MSQLCLLHIFGIAGSYSVLNIATSPWFFTRGGVVDLNVGSLRHVGNVGWYWSSTASTSASNAYFLRFGAANTQLSSTSIAASLT